MKKLLTLLILAFCLNGWAQYLKIDNRQIVNKDLRLKTKHLYSGCYQKTQSNVSLLDSIKT